MNPEARDLEFRKVRSLYTELNICVFILNTQATFFFGIQR